MTQVRFDDEMTAEKVIGALEFLDRFRIHPPLLVREPQVPVRQTVVGIEIKRLVELGDGVVVAPRH